LEARRNYIEDGLVEITPIIEDDENIMDGFGLSIEDLINLAGGVPSEEIKELSIKVVSRAEDVLDIYITTNLYEVVRVLNFGMRFISNTHMYVFDQQKEIGTRLLCNQVSMAREKDFKVIYTTAMGREDGDNWTGYYAWARLGYRMILGDDDRFVKRMESADRMEQNIVELLSTEEGRAFWLENGFTWMGEFLLEDDSSCLTQLRNYLEEKRLPYGID